MKINFTSLTTTLFVSLAIACSSETSRPASPPNIIYILADDLGYGDLGCYGQEKIETPHIDALAASGMLFTQHYSGSPVCAPARAVLLTGQHSGRAQVRGNDEWAERGEVWDYRAMLADSTLEGQRPIAEGTTTIGTLLQSAGYTTAIVGKWGLGAPHTVGVPNQQGFDYFYGYNCQRQAHTLYPVHLWENDRRVYLDNDTVPPNTKLPEGADPSDPESYDNYFLTDYAPELMFSRIQDFVGQKRKKPFFLYWATPIPHVPLQAPKRWIDHYVEKFGEEEPYLGEHSYFPTQHPRATYAAMVSYLDEQVGALIQQLKEQGVYENTLIIFTSDNGPTFNGGTDSPWFNSAGKFREERGYGKGFLYEGGIRVPMIASWPAEIEAGTETDHVSVFYDVMPTLAEIAEVEAPFDSDGISFLPTLKGEKQQEHAFLYWEFPSYGGQMAVRMGNWKAMRLSIHEGNSEWALFDLSTDPLEMNDVADENPGILQEMEAIVAAEHVPSSNSRWRYSALGE
ncbi:arylsulfatase [Cyclobacterium jeungdonense]|uniref:Arylsulfatase n=1 Tax=Cyclobacterium jeungdonense TaxID=708087 RepID=A0ABT8C2I4_9BACT|nr:arylsulfatase [Cyclobacterium jeungdonense]MDN3686247.1 arylsulfatase [Cyclobacterium jeungdonense]